MTSGLPIVILAGGEGRRLGGGKPLRQVGGISLLDRAIAMARSWSGDVAMAMRDVPMQSPVPVLVDDPAIEGPLAGLASALRRACERGAECVLTLPCDAPFLPIDLPTRLAAAIGNAAAAIAESGGEIHPVCGLWRAQALDRLDPYLASGRRSLRGYAEEVGFVAVDWGCDPIDPFFNVNTAEDLAIAETLLASGEG